MITRHTPTKYAQILQSYIDKGKRVQDFCKDYDLRARFAAALVMRFNIHHTQSCRTSVTKKQVETWILQYEGGRSISWIAKRANVAKGTVSAYLAVFEVHPCDQLKPDSRNMLERPAIADWYAYKIASTEAADYWKDRCAKFHRFWMDEIETIQLST